MKLRPRYGQGLLAGQSAAAVGGGRAGTQGTAAMNWKLQGFAGRGRNRKWHFGHPLPGLYKRFWQPKSLPSKFSLYLANLAQTDYSTCISKKKNLKLIN